VATSGGKAEFLEGFVNFGVVPLVSAFEAGEFDPYGEHRTPRAFDSFAMASNREVTASKSFYRL
jgi:hypothetical protein